MVCVLCKDGRSLFLIILSGGIHAREWISPATASFLMKELAENSRAHKSILNKYDIFIMPSMNPDGYEYSRNYDRMWRKTRSANRGSSCVGTDPNRNWGYNWGLKGASKNPCHGGDLYCLVKIFLISNQRPTEEPSPSRSRRPGPSGTSSSPASPASRCT